MGKLVSMLLPQKKASNETCHMNWIMQNLCIAVAVLSILKFYAFELKVVSRPCARQIMTNS